MKWRTDFNCGFELLDERGERGVVEHHLVLGVVRDVCDLIGEQAR